MIIEYGKGTTKYGPGVNIELDSDELACAIDTYLVSQGVHVSGPRTISINDEFCRYCFGKIYVDPSGFVITPNGEKLSGRGETN